VASHERLPRPPPGLALICKSDDQIRQIRGIRGALKDVVSACASHLNAGLAVLTLPGKGLLVRYDSEKQPLADAGKLVKQIEHEPVANSKAAFGETSLKDSSVECAQDTYGRIQCKSIAAPISTDDGDIEGLLVLAVRPDAHDFSDEHRLLLQGVASNIARIIDARFDRLTGLANRREFETLLEAMLARASSTPENHCILHLNLDRLHTIDESLGRDASNEAIRQVAKFVAGILGDTGTVARIGVDELAVLIENCPLDRGMVFGNELRRGIRDLKIVWERPIKLTASIGVARLARGSDTVESALAAAKIACIAAKDLGRDRVALYRHDNAMLLDGKERMQGVKAVQQALERDRFQLHCQRIKPLQGRGRKPHFEILIRGFDENDQLLLPGEFIPHAERSRLMPEIDRWVVSHTLDMLCNFQSVVSQQKILFAINVSGQSLCDDSFLTFVVDEFARTAIPPQSICIEITETSAILNMTQAMTFMSVLREKGLKFSLDDFGSGLSSFSYLKKLPLDFLKIDGQFVREIAEDAVSNAIVAAINQMSHAMGLKTIAEYVESPAIMTQLTGLGVDYGQGFGIEKPMPLERQLESLIGRARRTNEPERG